MQPRTFSDGEPTDADALFGRYVDAVLYARPPKLRSSAGSHLTGHVAELYSKLASMIAEVAAGTENSTVFSVTASEIHMPKTVFTPEDIGRSSFVEEGTNTISNEVYWEICEAAFSGEHVVDALRADLPMDFYWFDKSYGWYPDFGVWYEDSVTISDITFYFYVSEAYSDPAIADDLHVDPSYGQTVSAVRTNALAIVNAHSGESNYDRLRNYLLEICNLVAYNYDALDPNTPYGDPWQLLWAFDGDPATKIVCEGYSKAYKYLCDLTGFASIHCILADGNVTLSSGNGGAHMWNIVTMEDGNNYHVDVTHADNEGGAADMRMFLAPALSGDVASGYSYANGSHYTYSDSTKASFDEELVISSTAYDPTPAPTVVDSGFCGDSLTWTLYSDGALVLEGSGAMTDNSGSGGQIPQAPWYAYRESISSVSLPEGLTHIAANAFSYCAALTEISIPGDVNSIGAFAFMQCTGLTDVDFSSGLTSIDGNAFSNCASLTGVTLPDTLKTVGGYAFGGCSGLTSVTLPASLETLGASAFQGCSSLTAVSFGGTETDKAARVAVGDWSETGNAALFSAAWTYAGSVRPVTASGSCGRKLAWLLYADGELVIVGSGEMYGWNPEGSPWYAYRESILSAEVGEGVANIGGNAFGGCAGLTSVTIPVSVTSIGGEAFSGCDALTDVYYAGTAEDWSGISFGAGNSALSDVAVTFDLFTVSYDANGGKDAPATQTKIRDEDLTLRLNEPARDDATAPSFTVTLDPNGGSCDTASLGAGRTTSYSFTGWNTAADGSGTSYAPGASYETDEDVTLYAQWSEDIATSAVNLPTSVWMCHNFLGWAENANAESGVTGSFTPSGDVTLYAIWSIAHTPDEAVHENEVPATCSAAGSYDEVLYCSECGEELSREQKTIEKLAHTPGEPVHENEVPATTTQTGSYDEVICCTVCGEEISREHRTTPMLRTGWVKENGEWYFYDSEGQMVTSAWKKDSKGWCYLGSDGRMVTNGWAKDSKGWCWMGSDGYMVVKSKWVEYEGSWYYIEKGYRVENKWKKDSKGWCYLGSDGRMVTNGWAKDSKGYCWMGSNGYMVEKNMWLQHEGSWYYIEKGYRVENKWKKDSKGWCYLGSDGRMVTNGWAKDSKGDCWIGPDGYMIEQTMLVEYEGETYGIRNGYKVISGSIEVNGKTYTFDNNGVRIP